MTLVPPTEEQWNRNLAEQNQTEENIQRDIKHLREWLLKQPHLPKHMEDDRLKRFLFGCKFSLERTKSTLDTYYTVRANIPEFFTHRDPLRKDIQDSFKYVHFFPLPELTPEGYRVTLLRFKLLDADHLLPFPKAMRGLMTLDARLLEENCINNIMVLDLEGLTFGHFAKISPTMAINRKALLCMQDAFPMRLFKVIFINCPSIVEKLSTVVIPIFKPKLVQKAKLYTGGGECLHQHMPKEILPNEYGGQAGTFEELNESWRKKLIELRGWFAEEERISKADESKRLETKSPSSFNDINNLGGIPGSFRSLSVD